MSIRNRRITHDINSTLSIIILDNRDLLLEFTRPIDPKREVNEALEAVELAIAGETAKLQHLYVIRDMLKAELKMVEVVNPLYNSGSWEDQCSDCDMITTLVRSQFGEGAGDKVCEACERQREHEYGLPPMEAMEQ